MSKLSASALACYLESPRQFYWRYIAKLIPIQQSTANFDHDLLFGKLWAEFTDSFYKGVEESYNCEQIMKAWLDGVDGWVDDKKRDIKTKAFQTLMPQYYQTFDVNDGMRGKGSELWIENDRFVGKLDGLSNDNIVHEVKSTSRSPNLTEQLWKVGNSIQVKLYCVMTDADGYCIEFAWKDPPYQVFRGPIVKVTKEQKREWKTGLNSLAETISSLGDNPDNYICHTDCCLITKNYVGICSYQLLCDQGLNEETSIFYKKRSDDHRK